MKQVGKVLLNTGRMEFSTMTETKRDRESKLVKQLQEALHPTYISVQDTTLGANGCKICFYVRRFDVQDHCGVSLLPGEVKGRAAQAGSTGNLDGATKNSWLQPEDQNPDQIG